VQVGHFGGVLHGDNGLLVFPIILEEHLADEPFILAHPEQERSYSASKPLSMNREKKFQHMNKSKGSKKMKNSSVHWD
jgi:hypothetical protein